MKYNIFKSEQIKKESKKNLSPIYVLIIMGIIMIVSSPYFQDGMIRYSDSPYHLSRINSIANELQNGLFMSKTHYLQCYGYGYGSGFFYQDTLLYIPAIFMCLGMSLEHACKLFEITLLFLIAGTTFYSAWSLTGHRAASLIASVISVCSWPLLSCFHRDMSMGAMNSAIFIPVTLAGLILFLYRGKSVTMLMLGTIGLFYTQSIGVFLTAIACAIILFYSLPSLYRQNKLLAKLKELFIAMATVLLMTAPYWLQMYEQSRKQKLKVVTPWTTSEENVFSSLLDVISSTSGLGYLLFIALLFCFIMAIFHHLNHEQVDTNILLIPTICFIGVSMWKGFWHFFNTTLHIRILQFPGRMFVIAGFLIALCLAGQIAKININNRYLRVGIYFGILSIVLFITITTSFPKFFHGPVLKSNDPESVIYQVEHGEVAGVGAGEEWLPLEAHPENMQYPELAIGADGSTVQGNKSKGMSQFTFQAKDDVEYYIVPYIYYKGYVAFSENGTQLDVDKDEKNGYVKVDMKHDVIGQKITVLYKTTNGQLISYIMFVMGIIWWTIWKFICKKRKLNRNGSCIYEENKKTI